MTHAANQVGYKVLMLLLWLSQSPLTRDEMLEKLEVLTQKPHSVDALELYLATLRHAGCVIQRNPEKLGGRYRLLVHTFGPPCNAQSWEALSKIWDVASETLSPRDMMVFYRWLLRYFGTLGHDEAVRSHKSHFVANKRLTPLLAQESLMMELLRYCDSEQSIELLYNASSRGPRELLVTPKSVLFQGGQLYLVGQTPLSPEQVMLRLERILRIKPAPAHRPTNHTPQPIVIRFVSNSPPTIPQFTGLQSVTPSPQDPDQAIATFAGDNPFLVTQQLLASGLAFQVVSPHSYYLQLVQQLKATQEFYTHVG